MELETRACDRLCSSLRTDMHSKPPESFPGLVCPMVAVATCHPREPPGCRKEVVIALGEH